MFQIKSRFFWIAIWIYSYRCYMKLLLVLSITTINVIITKVIIIIIIFTNSYKYEYATAYGFQHQYLASCSFPLLLTVLYVLCVKGREDALYWALWAAFSTAMWAVVIHLISSSICKYYLYCSLFAASRRGWWNPPWRRYIPADSCRCWGKNPHRHTAETRPRNRQCRRAIRSQNAVGVLIIW